MQHTGIYGYGYRLLEHPGFRLQAIASEITGDNATHALNRGGAYAQEIQAPWDSFDLTAASMNATPPAPSSTDG